MEFFLLGAYKDLFMIRDKIWNEKRVGFFGCILKVISYCAENKEI